MRPTALEGFSLERADNFRQYRFYVISQPNVAVTASCWFLKCPVLVITSGREALSEFFCGLREKFEYARPDQTQPDPIRPRDAFEKLISLERVDRFTSGLLCLI